MMRALLHRLAHLLRINGSRVEIGASFQPPPWPIWVVCATCGKRRQIGTTGGFLIDETFDDDRSAC